MAEKGLTTVAKKATASDNGLWSRVWVITGDPCLCRITVDTAVEEAGNPRRLRFGKGDEKALKVALTAFSFNAVADALIVTSPNAEALSACLQAIEEGTLTASVLVIVVPGDTLDGRTKFSLALGKHKKEAAMFHFDPIEVGNTKALASHLGEWQEYTKLTLAAGVKDWLLANAPQTMAKIKGAGGKKEVSCYDLETLEAELGKVEAVCAQTGKVLLSDVVQLCVFSQEIDIWAFVQSAIDGRSDRVLRALEGMQITQTDAGALWLLVAQLEFSMLLKSLVEGGERNVDALQEQMSLEGVLGRYLADDFTTLPEVAPPPAPNPFRIRKALENIDRVKRKALEYQYVAALCAIRDLRSGVAVGVVLPYLAFALAGNFSYSKPLLNLYE